VGRASALWNASLVKLDQLDLAAALDLALEALATYEENGDLRRTGALRAQIACIELEFTPPNATSALHHLALAEPEVEWGGAGVIAKARHRLTRARAHRELGDPDAAQRALDESAQLLPADAPGLRAWHSVVLAQLAADRRDFDAAHGHLQDAVQRLTALGADSDAGRAWTRLGDTLAQIGEHARAADAYRRAGVSLGLRPSR
jgi:tetratricopeptide (TPR) repeat protein